MLGFHRCRHFSSFPSPSYMRRAALRTAGAFSLKERLGCSSQPRPNRPCVPVDRPRSMFRPPLCLARLPGLVSLASHWSLCVGFLAFRREGTTFSSLSSQMFAQESPSYLPAACNSLVMLTACLCGTACAVSTPARSDSRHRMLVINDGRTFARCPLHAPRL